MRISRRGIGNIMNDYLKPLAYGATTEYAMKTVAFNLGGETFALPKPNPTQDWATYFGQPHMIAGVGMAVGLPMIFKKLGRDYRVAAMGYIGGKIVSDTFGVSRSPFRTSPNAPPVATETSYVRSS